MHAKTFLHESLSSVMHLKRLVTLEIMVSTAITDKKISVTSLGRAIGGSALERSNIRRSDRFIGNSKIHGEREAIYQLMMNRLVGSNLQPHIIVDWSHIPNTTHYVLRAALATEGRSLTIYEEVHPKEKENNAKVHNEFLDKLKELLPRDCCPIIITDAGFHNPWFKKVKALGFDYVGRIRGKKSYRMLGKKDWQCCKDLFKKASYERKYIGEVELCLTNKLATHFYLIKNKKKGRVSLNKLGKKSQYKNDKEHSASANEPWLLATSLVKGRNIFNLYAKRMQIEEGFRDLKSTQYGFSLEKARSKSIGRIEILLLIAMLASLIAWITGWVGEKMEYQYQFQANSTKKKRVLSLFFLGCQMIKKKINISMKAFNEAISNNWEIVTC
jgi:hypothetical protein